MPFDAEQIRYMKTHGLTPQDAIDFPCSPSWAGYYQQTDMMHEDTDKKGADLSGIQDELSIYNHRLERLELRNEAGPADKQEIYELRHLVKKLTERVNNVGKFSAGKY